MPISSGKATGQTVAQIFKNRNLVQWWNYPTQFFNGSGEMGTDYGLGGFKPVGSISSGTVVYAARPAEYYQPGQSSIGYIIQILTPEGHLIHYQHMRSSSVSVNQSIGVGQVIGISGGCPAGAYQSNGTCSYGDNWSTGQHIEVRYSNSYHSQATDPFVAGSWINPHAIFVAMAGGLPVGPVGSSNVVFPTAFSDLSINVSSLFAKSPITPNESVVQFFSNIDNRQAITPPWAIQPSQYDSTASLPVVGDVTFPDPFAWIGQFFTNIADDIQAVIFDFILIGGGVFICFKVFSELVHLPALLNATTRLASAAGALAV